jgi:ATP-dependent RNA helicase DeaD
MDEEKLEQQTIEESELIQPENELPPAKWEELSPEMKSYAEKAGWNSLMPVQAMTIPYVLARRDLMVQSRTGSGKTGAYLLPALKRIDKGLAECQALVVAPTRELALQIETEAEKMTAGSGISSVAVYGGTGYDKQQKAIPGAQIVIGTPGRLLDFMLRGTLKLAKLRVLILDEADRMLSMGFYPDMCQLKRYLPQKYNGYLFSATFTPRVLSLAGQFLEKPEFLSLSKDNVHVKEIQHLFCQVPAMEKDRSLVRILETESPDSVIVFCNMKTTVHYVAVVLKRFGFEAEELSADLPQKKREALIQRLREGQLKVLVSSDIAARGIDIPALSMVIQYEPPEEQELYIHRAGRTGRAGAAGTSVTLVTAGEKVKLNMIAKAYNIEMKELPLPTEEEVEKVISERLQTNMEQLARSLDLLQKERAARFVSMARTIGATEEGVTLLAALLDRCYQDRIMAGSDSYVPRVEKEKRGEGRGRGRRKK